MFALPRSVCGAMRLCAIVWLVLIYYSCLVESIISGPFPRKVITRIDSTVEFTCSVNTSQLTAGTFNTFSWREDGVATVGQDEREEIGDVRSSTITLTVTEENLSGVLIQCSVITVNPLSQVFGGNATLITYGPPQAVSNLTTMVTQNALILSWSAPSSPVQLHYTVTANISTTIRMTNNTNITITREEVMTALNSSECDYYTFHVIASNPAGNSTPANLTTPVTFVPDPENVQYNMCISMDNITMISFEPLDGYEYFIANESECLNATWSTTNGLTVFQIPYPHNCTVLTILAEHNCTNELIPVNISNGTGQCPRSSTATMTTPTIDASSSPQVLVIIAVVAVILVIIGVVSVITIIVLLVSVRQRKRKDSLVKPEDGSVSTVDTEFKDEKTSQFKADKSIPSLQNKQPMSDYMSPADALKQNGDSSTLKALQKQTPGLVSSSVSEYATPSVPHHNTQKVQDMPLYSDVFETQKGTTWRSSQRKSLTHTNKSPAGSPLPPPPPPSFGTDEYSSLQHDLGGPNQPLVDQDQHVYDSALTDQPQYSSITQPKKTKYTDVQFSPNAGLTIQGNTNTVQYSVVGDTPNMEYSVVGPKTNTSQDSPPPPPPPPPSADVVRDMMIH